MKKALLVGAAIISAAGMTSALANQITVGPGYGPYQTGSGGEFTMKPVNPAGWLDISLYAAGVTRDVGGNTGTYQSFCIEGGETINANTTYDAVKSQNAVWGSVGPAGDPLSVGTGWLYSQFARASWTAGLSYDYTNPGRSTGAGSSADLLQLAIWWLEGENSVAYNAGNLYMKGVVDKFGSEALAKANGSWNYGVYAVNLTAVTTGARAQDGLIYVPDGGMTLMLLGVGLGGLALTNRRARR